MSAGVAAQRARWRSPVADTRDSLGTQSRCVATGPLQSLPTARAQQPAAGIGQGSTSPDHQRT